MISYILNPFIFCIFPYWYVSIYIKKCNSKFSLCSWPMKKIMVLIASLWKNTSEEGREYFIDKAKCDSDRYKTEMKAFSQTEIYKKHKKLQKKHRRLKQRIKGQTSKEISLQALLPISEFVLNFNALSKEMLQNLAYL